MRKREVKVGVRVVMATDHTSGAISVKAGMEGEIVDIDGLWTPKVWFYALGKDKDEDSRWTCILDLRLVK